MINTNNIIISLKIFKVKEKFEPQHSYKNLKILVVRLGADIIINIFKAFLQGLNFQRRLNRGVYFWFGWNFVLVPFQCANYRALSLGN